MCLPLMHLWSKWKDLYIGVGVKQIRYCEQCGKAQTRWS